MNPHSVVEVNVRAVKFVDKSDANFMILTDVGASVKAWGRRGIAWGGTAGFALGVGFVAIPFSSKILSFGILGTLTVVTVEGAFIAGALGALAALVYGHGTRQVPGQPVCDHPIRRRAA